jgi:6-methylsalicylate decarboxylase
VAPSSPLGIESLPPDDAASLIGAYHDGAAQLPGELRAWATAGVTDPDPAALAAALDRGFVGACLPADALSGPEGFERCGPLLAVLEERGAPLLVHPGPARSGHGAFGLAHAGAAREGPSSAGRWMPPWWPALTDYVADMNAAWHAFAAFGRPNHPRLRVCFAMLAGLAPLHRERLDARGGRARVDPDVFLDTSSYGVRAVDAVLRALGVDVLVHGSDRPVIPAAELPLGEAVDTALRARNPARLLQEVLV